MAGRREDLEIVIGADLGGLAADLSRSKQMLQQHARDVDRIGTPKASDFKLSIDIKGLRAAARDLRELADQSRKTESSLRSVARSLSSAGGSMAGFAAKVAVAGGTLVALEAGLGGLGEIARQAKESVAMAAEVEQNTIAFEAMLGSAQRAKDLMLDLRKFAADTPFSAKEVTESGRQLLAYGIEAKDVLSTLKVLGTVSAGVGSPLKDNVLRYGTTRVQGRAMQQDLNQFTTAGINIYPGIAKALNIDIEQVRKRTEQFGIEVNALNFALEDLAKNQFAGLLEKQANSLKGNWEQLTDAFDRAKVKLGEVIAEEVGLRTAARSLQGFAGELERGIGGERFRAGVRLVGDLVKGGAQLAYEFGRAGAQIAAINFDGFAHASPQVADLAKNVGRVVTGLKDFKLDELAVANLGISLFESIVTPVARAADWVQVEGQAYADGFNRNFIGPVDKWIDRLERAKDVARTVWEAPDKAVDWVGRNGFAPEKWEASKRMRMDREFLAEHAIPAPLIPKHGLAGLFEFDDSLVPKAADLVRNAKDFSFAPPLAGEPDANVNFRYRHMRRLMEDARFLSEVAGFKQFKPFHDQLLKQHHEFLLPFSDDPGKDILRLERMFEAGWVPDRRADWVPPATQAPKTNVQSLQDRTAEFRDLVTKGVEARKIQQSTEVMRAGFRDMFASIDKAESLGRTVANPLALAAALGPFAPAASAIVAPNGGAFRASEMMLPKDNRTPAHLVELATRTNEQFAPGLGLEVKLAALEDILKRDLISKDTFDKARASTIGDVADRMGIGGPAKLTDAVLAGSQEDARLLSNFFAGTARQTTDDLLKQIVYLMQAVKDNTGRAADNRPRVVDFGSGGDF